MRQNVADFAVLAFADRKHQPDIGALVALQGRVDRTIFDAVNLDALFQFIKLALRDFAMGTDAIAPQPAGIGQFEHARQPAVIGQQQQAFGVEIEPADADQPRQALRQIVEHRRPPFRVGMGGHQPARLVKHEQPGAFARRQRLAVDGDDIVGGDVERRRIDQAAVDGDAALHDPFLGVAPRGQSCPRHHLGNALAGFLFARRSRRTALVGLALAVFAAAAERRTFYKDLAVVLVVAAGPIGRLRFAARMFLPGTAAFARALEFRTVSKWAIALGAILTRTRKARTLVAAAVLARFVETGFVETSCAIAGGAGITPGMIGRRSIALLPRLRIAAIHTALPRGALAIPRGALAIPRGALAIPVAAAKILAWAAVAAIRRTARKFLVAAEFSLALRTIAIARRPRTERAVSSRPVAIFPKTFAARRRGSLVAATVPWRIRLLVGEFPVGELPGRTRAGARGAVVLTRIRAIAARGIGTLLAATILARAKLLARFRTIAAWSIVPVETWRTIGKRPIAARTRCIAIAARRRAFAFAGIGFARARIRFFAIRLGTVWFAGVGALLAIAFSGEIALGEFLVGPAGGTRAALAAGGPTTRAAGVVVFIA